MRFSKHVFTIAAMSLVPIATATAARAQDTTPAPAASAAPTFMDKEYDGRLHVMVAPYIWGPSVKANFEFSVPTLPRRPPRIAQGSVQVGPSDYAPKLNSAFMFAFDARKGNFDLFGDAIYLNASNNASIASSISGPLGRFNIPVNVNASAHLATAIWEAAAGYTVARGHNADLSIFAGVRQFPINVNIGYDATVGRRGILAPSGTVTLDTHTNDIIFGLRGKAFFGDGRLYVPYYVDLGTSTYINSQSWQAYTGAGYAFPHGQSIVALWRALNYDGFPPTSGVQKLSMYGPLLGYTFNL
jgi:hypothetical protein